VLTSPGVSGNALSDVEDAEITDAGGVAGVDDPKGQKLLLRSTSFVDAGGVASGAVDGADEIFE
jgi:hypothetical protein